ncbi:RNA-guided pseudouridylation complex pseudouridine synthase subunit Cbf5 [Geoglobus acetivorans]|uniref:Probable tRNA pseudouridine synthase B n=2 Tax=Geoglobus acetivorans TaxID=565033 RepID=A0ABZ3GZY4_GEOAI|nr:RNA-guided pseudouridylation complex pseudouridine synthase subunit Cbf5 [Geoglobus acetivorans]
MKRMVPDFEDRFYIREEGEPGEHGIYPYHRPMREYITKGLVCIDKPMGPSSHEVVVWIRKILEVEKTGHTGTLDPRVTGVLPVLIENGTKLVKYLQESDKEYITLMHLHADARKEDIERVMKLFVGKIYQRPPLKSAVKKRLRIREIKDIEVLEIDGRDVLFRVLCEAGTYIRKLCIDIGEVLGTGAHMQELRRTRTGIFDESNTYTLHDLLDAYMFWKEDGEEKYLREIIMPMEEAAKTMKKVVIKDTAVDALCHGADLTARGMHYIEKSIKAGDVIALFTLKNELVAIAKTIVSAEEMFRMKKGVVAKTLRVIMERGTYPPYWKGKGAGEI